MLHAHACRARGPPTSEGGGYGRDAPKRDDRDYRSGPSSGPPSGPDPRGGYGGPPPGLDRGPAPAAGGYGAPAAGYGPGQGGHGSSAGGPPGYGQPAPQQVRRGRTKCCTSRVPAIVLFSFFPLDGRSSCAWKWMGGVELGT